MANLEYPRAAVDLDDDKVGLRSSWYVETVSVEVNERGGYGIYGNRIWPDSVLMPRPCKSRAPRMREMK